MAIFDSFLDPSTQLWFGCIRAIFINLLRNGLLALDTSRQTPLRFIILTATVDPTEFRNEVAM